ncbi:MAG: hypothetical protein H0V71_12780 [Chloroflexi bacterium]|nr:hypothetical protein [Chloroflexota bacterium]
MAEQLLLLPRMFALSVSECPGSSILTATKKQQPIEPHWYLLGMAAGNGCRPAAVSVP